MLAKLFKSSNSRSERRSFAEAISDPDGHGLEWIERTPQGEIRYHHEPKTGFLKRLTGPRPASR